MWSISNSDNDYNISEQQETKEQEAHNKRCNKILTKLKRRSWTQYSTISVMRELKTASGWFYSKLLELLKDKDIIRYRNQLTKLVNRSITYDMEHLDKLLEVYKPELKELSILNTNIFIYDITCKLSILAKYYNVYDLCNQLNIWHIDEVRTFAAGKLSIKETFQLIQRVPNWYVGWLYPLIDSEFIYTDEFLLAVENFSAHQFSLLYTNIDKLVDKLIAKNVGLGVLLDMYAHDSNMTTSSFDKLKEWSLATDNKRLIELFFADYTYTPTVVIRDSTRKDNAIPKSLSCIIMSITGELHNDPINMINLGEYVELLKDEYPAEFDDVMAEIVTRSFNLTNRTATNNLLFLHQPTLTKIGLVREGNITGWKKLGEPTRINIPFHSRMIMSRYYNMN